MFVTIEYSLIEHTRHDIFPSWSHLTFVTGDSGNYDMSNAYLAICFAYLHSDRIDVNMLALQQYSGSSDEESEENNSLVEQFKPIAPENTVYSVQKQLTVCAAPPVAPTALDDDKIHIHPDTKELSYNPKYEELFAPVVGPVNPYKTQQELVDRNMLSGHVEPAHVSDFQFENQRRTFASFGYALDPSVSLDGQIKVVGSTDEGKNPDNVTTVFEKTKTRPLDKRKRKKNSDAGDIEGFLGPWGGFEDAQTIAKPTEEEQAELDEILSKKNRRGNIYLPFV